MILNAIEDVVGYTLAQANALVRNGDILVAKDAYLECVELDSDNSAAWYGLGVVNHQLGDEEAAIVAFERSFQLNRFHAPTAANLAVLYSQRDKDSASKYANAALELGLVDETLRSIIGHHDNEARDHTSITQADDKEQGVPGEVEGQTAVEQPTEVVEPILIASSVSPISTPNGQVEIQSDETSSDLVVDVTKLLDEGEFERALNLITPAIESEHADNADLWYLCASALASLDLVEDAINSLNYCLELDEHNLLARQLLDNITAKTSEQTVSDEETPSNDEIDEDEETIPTLISAEVITHAEYSGEEIFDDREPEVIEEEGPSESPYIALEDSLVVLLRQANEATSSGEHATAVQLWKNIIENHGSTSDAWNGMAGALEAAGHIDKSQQCRNKAQELLASESSDDSGITDSVDLVAAAVEARELITSNEFTVDDDVNVAIEWYNKGLTLLTEDKGLQALNSFERVISTAPREERELRVRAHNGRGHALHQLGRFAESIQSYHQAISMDPSSVSGRTLYNMGSSYAAMEHFEDAIRCFEQALERELDEEETRLCQTQMNRCQLLLKEQLKTQRIRQS